MTRSESNVDDLHSVLKSTTRRRIARGGDELMPVRRCGASPLMSGYGLALSCWNQ